MKGPRRAILLAAGYGTRMDPLSRSVPKPLLPLWRRPMVDHALDLLASWGVTDVYVNLHHAADAIADHLSHRHDAPRITLGYEPSILGTGGVLRCARTFIGTEPFWMFNSDVAADLDPSPLIAAFRRRHAIAALWMTAAAGPRTVQVDRGRIATFAADAPGSPATYTFCGLQLVHPDLLRHLPRRAFCTILAAYEAAMRRGKPVLGVEVPSAFWADVGTPDAYIDAHRDVRRAYYAHRPGGRLYTPRMTRSQRRLGQSGVTCRGCVATAPGAVVERGAVITDSIVAAGGHVSKAACLNRAVVGPGAHVSGEVSGIVVSLAGMRDPGLDAAVRLLGWDRSRTLAMRLPPRGSDRTFTRLRCGPKQAIAIHYGTGRPENEQYAAQARFLASAGLPVPRILANRPSARLTLMEDLGERDLMRYARTAPARNVQQVYRKVLRAVVLLHTTVSCEARRRRVPLAAPFGPDLYKWERDLFGAHFLKRRLHLPAAQRAAVLRELGRIEAVLDRQPAVLLHRDLQSSNIILRAGRPRFIDFQGMRWGPAVYDVASLVCDPYVSLPLPVQHTLVADYARQRSLDPEAFMRVFWFGAAQRLCQALGAFGRLSAQPGTRSFERFFAPGIAMLHRTLDHLPPLPALRRALPRHPRL